MMPPPNGAPLPTAPLPMMPGNGMLLTALPGTPAVGVGGGGGDQLRSRFDQLRRQRDLLTEQLEAKGRQLQGLIDTK